MCVCVPRTNQDSFTMLRAEDPIIFQTSNPPQPPRGTAKFHVTDGNPTVALCVYCTLLKC